MTKDNMKGDSLTRKRFVAGGAVLLVFFIVGWRVLGWGSQPDVTLSRDGFSMNTLIRISVTGNEGDVRSALDSSFALLEHLNNELSLYQEGSTLSKINAHAGGGALLVSSDIFAAVAKAREMCQLTDGVFNPLIGPITKLWKINQSPDEPDAFSLPSQASLDAALTLTDPAGLELQSNGAVRLARRGAALDLGGIAKGYASTEIVKLLQARGMASALVNLGGNVHVLGTKEGAPWNIGIRNPIDETMEPIALVLSVADEERQGLAVVTSGGYERYRVVNGVRYSHFFDPLTGLPVSNDLLSATLVTPDGSVADALATAFMIMGSERAIQFLSAHPDLGAVLICRGASGGLEILVTENLRGMVRQSLTEVSFITASF